MWFIVERYSPGVDIAEVRTDTLRLAATTAELAADGVGVRYLGSSFIPGEESCFSRFESKTLEAVRMACDRSLFRYDRILLTEEFTEPTIEPDPGEPPP